METKEGIFCVYIILDPILFYSRTEMFNTKSGMVTWMMHNVYINHTG